MSTPETVMKRLGERARAMGVDPPKEWRGRTTAAYPDGRAFLDGWLGESWRRRLFGTNFCRVLILPDRLAVFADRREDLFARSAA